MISESAQQLYSATAATTVAVAALTSRADHQQSTIFVNMRPWLSDTNVLWMDLQCLACLRIYSGTGCVREDKLMGIGGIFEIVGTLLAFSEKNPETLEK